jgi:arylsulfatase A-like enzyme
MRRRMLDALLELHRLQDHDDNPLILSANNQNELAWRMQSSVPEVADLSDEPEETFELYGEDSRTPGTYAANCILARRLAERGVRFTQLFHQGWDQHGNLPGALRTQCRETDQASAALVVDLERRGLLDDTLVIWGGEFGRTSYCQGKLTANGFGRDHHPRCFSMWMAGGGVNAGHTHGSTDDLGYNIVENPMDVHDLQATILHILGIDHERLTYKFQGRRYRLTDVHGKVIEPLLS